MKIILSSTRHHYVAIVSIILIMLVTVALIAGMVGCGQPGFECTPMAAAGTYHTVGLKADGTVVAVGPSYWFWAFLEVDDSLLDVDGWDLK